MSSKELENMTHPSSRSRPGPSTAQPPGKGEQACWSVSQLNDRNNGRRRRSRLRGPERTRRELSLPLPSTSPEACMIWTFPPLSLPSRLVCSKPFSLGAPVSMTPMLKCGS
jgi:hypothetical protein